jgi:fructokinase
MRFGIDLGGTKIEILALGNDGKEMYRHRVPTPKDSYEDTVVAIRDLVQGAEAKISEEGSLGVCIPGAISRKTGLVKNANQTRLIGHPLDKDLSAALNRPVRVENDAKCFALSEASDGGGAGYDVVFGVILGTGVGGGIIINGKVLSGANRIAGEWGHNYLPAPTPTEYEAAPRCNCGRFGDIESWCCGPALMRQYKARTGKDFTPKDIAEAARGGEKIALEEMEGFYDRLGRALGSVVSIIDPDIIVLGGGVSNIEELYAELPERVERYAFNPEGPANIVKNVHGDSSGVRGAAWLWGTNEVPYALPKKE